MDIGTYIREKDLQDNRIRTQKELDNLQRKSIEASLNNIRFTRIISIFSLILSVSSLLVAIFK
jgi:hypothetical protein